MPFFFLYKREFVTTFCFHTLVRREAHITTNSGRHAHIIQAGELHVQFEFGCVVHHMRVGHVSIWRGFNFVLLLTSACVSQRGRVSRLA